MKRNSIFICLFFAIAANLFTAAKAQVNTTDSLALVDLYNSDNGPHWYNHINWLTAKPVSTWYGIIVTGNRVVSVSLESNGLHNTIPTSIGNLTKLSTLDLYDNYLSSTIPSSIYNITSLNKLILSTNQLSGSIPAEIGNLTNLTALELDDNQLTGTIPVEIGNLTNLLGLSLFGNQLTGNIPAEIGNLTKLTYLELGLNNIAGAIPSSIGNLTNLTLLFLQDAQLSGTIPPSLGNLTKLTAFNLNNNQLTGTIPSSLGNLTKLLGLILNNNQLSGAIPASLAKLSYVNLDYNHLSRFGGFHSLTDSNYQVYCTLNHNFFTFNGLQFIAKNYSANISYNPQDTILPIHQNGKTLSISAGGTVNNNTYKWFKIGETKATIIKGDSTFTPSANGQYYATVNNSIATTLTLHSDTVSYSIPLPQTQNSVANIAAVKEVNNHFSIYPNPAKDVIHVQVNGNTIVIVTNGSGKILLSKTIINSGEINVSAFANGIYYIQNKTTGETQKVMVLH